MEFNIDTLVKCLKINQTSNEELKTNTEYLSKCKEFPNFASFLLQIACSSQQEYSQEIKLNAAIQLQNFIKANWKFTNDTEKNKLLIFDETLPMIIISFEEKEFICKHLLDGVQYCILTDNIKILKQLNQCVKKILIYNFENTWNEGFISKVLECLKSNDQKLVYTGIVLFHQLSKIYEYEVCYKKDNYNSKFALVNEYFLFILNQCSDPSIHIQAVFIAKILKIYSKNFKGTLSETVSSLANLEKWIEYILYYLQVPIDITLPQEKQIVFWKLKKVSYNLIESIYKKHSPRTISQNSKDYEKYLYEKFTMKFFITIKTIYINIAESPKYIDDYCLCIIYKLFTSMINLKHYLEEVLAIFMGEFKLKIVNDCLLTKDDINLWITKPKEYIINSLNIEFNYHTKRYTSFQLVYSILQYDPCKKKTNTANQVPSVFKPFYEFLLTLLQTNQVEANKEIEAIKSDPQINEENINEFIYKNPEKIKHNLIKESLLYILKSVISILIKKAPETLGNVVEMFVINEIDSPIGILRECACTFIELLKDYKFTSDQLIVTITKKICGLLEKEKLLPIRVMSALALPEMLKYTNIQNLLKGNIKILLVIYLKLISEIDLGELIECLQEIFKYFKGEVREYIVQLCDCLVKYFIKLSQKEIEEEDDDQNDTEVVLNQIIETITDIVRIYINDPEIYSKIEIYVNVILTFCIRNDFFQYIESGFDLILEIVSNAKVLSNTIWIYYNKLIYSVIGTDKEISQSSEKAIEGPHWENANQISKIICFYIIKDYNTFLVGKDQNGICYLAQTFRYINQLVGLCEIKKSYRKIKGSFEIFRIILETGREKVDNVLCLILEFLLKHIENCVNSNYKLFLCELLSSCTLYNPTLTIKYFEEKKAFEGIMNFWMSNIEKVEMKQETRLNLMGLCSLVSVASIIDNQFFSNSTKIIIEAIIMLTEKAANIRIKDDKEDKLNQEERENLLKELDNDDNLDENEKVDSFQKFIDDKALKDDDLMESNEFSYDDCDDWFVEEELTEIDKQNEILFVKNMFTLLSSKYSAYLEHIKQLVGEANLIKLQNIINSEENRIHSRTITTSNNSKGNDNNNNNSTLNSNHN